MLQIQGAALANKTQLLSFLHLLVMTTTVSLLDYYAVAFHMMMCYGTDNVLKMKLSAVLTLTCHGSSRHSMRPPLRILNLGSAIIILFWI